MFARAMNNISREYGNGFAVIYLTLVKRLIGPAINNPESISDTDFSRSSRLAGSVNPSLFAVYARQDLGPNFSSFAT